MNEQTKQLIEILANIDSTKCWNEGDCGNCILYIDVVLNHNCGDCFEDGKYKDDICTVIGLLADKIQDLRKEGKI